MTEQDNNFLIKNGLSVGTGKHQVLDSSGRITGNYFTLNAGGRYLSAGVDLWDLMSSQGIPPLSTNAWNDTYANVLFTSGEWDAVYSYVNSDSATNNTDYNRTTYVNVTGDTITGELDVLGSVNLHDDTYVEGSLRVDGHTYLSAAMYVENDSHIMGDLRVDGDVWLAVETTNPKSIYLGATNLDRVVFHADVDSDIIPDDNVTYDLGTSTQQWRELFVQDISATRDVFVDNDLLVSANGTVGEDFRVSGHTTVGGDTVLSGTLDVKGFTTLHDDLSVRGDLYVDGNAYLSAGEDGNIYVGDVDTDSVIFQADVNSNIIPESTLIFDLGTDDKHWNTLYVNDVSASNDIRVKDTLYSDTIRADDGDFIQIAAGMDDTAGSFIRLHQDNRMFVHADYINFGDLWEDSDNYQPWVMQIFTDEQQIKMDSTLDVSMDATFKSDVWIKGNLRVDGNAYLSAGASGVINVGDTNTDNVVFHADVDSNIIPDDDVTFDLGTNTQQWKELFVQDISATNDVFVDNDLLVGANGTIGGDFRVNGHATVSGNTVLSGTLDVDDATYIYDTLDVELDTRLHSDLFVTENTTVSGNTTLSGTLDVDDATYIYDTLDVELDTRLHSNLFVTENTTVSGNTTLSGMLDVKDFTTLHDDLSVKGDLYVDGNAYLSAGVDGIINVGDTNTDNVVFHADIDSNIIPDDDVTYDLGTSTQQWQTLYVQDISATGDVTIDDKLTVQGHVSAVSGMTLTGDLTADDSVYIKGNIVVEGHAYFGYGAGSNQINLGDPNVDEIVVHADIGSDLIPYPGSTHDLGMRSKRWRELFVDTVDATGTIQTTGNISTSGAYVQSKSITFDQHVQTIENVWRSQSGQPHNTTLTVETFDHTKYQSAQYTIMIQSDPIQTGDNSVTTVNASFVSDGTTINGTVYGDVNVGPVDPLIGVNMTGNNNMYTLNITVGPYAKMMVTGKAMFLQ
jgi:cytoskeletal protein CcmA (bactofilin family)